jgi:hypothetical protein
VGIAGLSSIPYSIHYSSIAFILIVVVGDMNSLPIFYVVCRWGFVTHGCIDGYSRLITYLHTSTTNTAKTVLHLFVQACVRHGLPSRTRFDHGGENVDVAIFMNLVRGVDRGSALTGRSVHNQRIERLWRDVATQVTEFFYKLFYELEDEGVCDITDDLHLCALHITFLPEINIRMNEFRLAWNKHRLRTEGNRCPEQIWLQGMLENANSGHVTTSEAFSTPISLDVRLEDALRTFNVDIQPFLASDGLEVPQAQYSVDQLTHDRVQNATLGLSDLKTKFKTVLNILQEPHHQ